jgi:hypothetical protein
MKNLPKINKKILFATPIALLLLSVSFLTVRAQEVQRTITANPSVIETMDPGSYKEGTMHVTNDSDNELSFTVETKDFIVVDSIGTPNVLPVGTLDNKYSAAAWIGVSPSRFILKPHQRQELNYYIQIPPGAKPGGHYAAISYTPAIVQATEQTGTNVTSELGTLFYITVNGPVTENALISIFNAPFKEYGPVNIFTQIKNLGDLHIRPIGQVEITNIFGGKQVVKLTEQNIFPGGVSRDYENKAGKGFMIGPYEAKLTALYGKNNMKLLVAKTTFWVFPWKITVVIILIIIAVVLYFTLWRKRKTTKETQTPQDETAN